MNLKSSREPWRLASVAAAAAVILSGCATPPSESEPKPAAPIVVEAPKPEAPAEPLLSPAQARTEAQRLALAAIDLLQNGREADARTALEKASTLDPANVLARKLLGQVNADAQVELGATFFQYKVQRDDTLSKLAQTYLGDLYRFYILAKYNGIAVPGKLAAGQVIKIPGKSAAAAAARQPAAPAAKAPTAERPVATPPAATAPAAQTPAAAAPATAAPAAAAPATEAPAATAPATEAPAATAPASEAPAATAPASEAPAATAPATEAPAATAPAAAPMPPAAPEPAPAPAAEVPQSKTVSTLMREGAEQQRSGNLEGAYATFSEAARAEPGNRDAILQRDAARVALVRRYDREATQAYRRQNLELAIKKWEQILALDPDNQKATLERARALDLQTKMSEKFGTTPKK